MPSSLVNGAVSSPPPLSGTRVSTVANVGDNSGRSSSASATSSPSPARSSQFVAPYTDLSRAFTAASAANDNTGSATAATRGVGRAVRSPGRDGSAVGGPPLPSAYSGTERKQLHAHPLQHRWDARVLLPLPGPSNARLLATGSPPVSPPRQERLLTASNAAAADSLKANTNHTALTSAVRGAEGPSSSMLSRSFQDSTFFSDGRRRLGDASATAPAAGSATLATATLPTNRGIDDIGTSVSVSSGRASTLATGTSATLSSDGGKDRRVNGTSSASAAGGGTTVNEDRPLAYQALLSRRAEPLCNPQQLPSTVAERGESGGAANASSHSSSSGASALVPPMCMLATASVSSFGYSGGGGSNQHLHAHPFSLLPGTKTSPGIGAWMPYTPPAAVSAQPWESEEGSMSVSLADRRQALSSNAASSSPVPVGAAASAGDEERGKSRPAFRPSPIVENAEWKGCEASLITHAPTPSSAPTMENIAAEEEVEGNQEAVGVKAMTAAAENTHTSFSLLTSSTEATRPIDSIMPVHVDAATSMLPVRRIKRRPPPLFNATPQNTSMNTPAVDFAASPQALVSLPLPQSVESRPAVEEAPLMLQPPPGLPSELNSVKLSSRQLTMATATTTSTRATAGPTPSGFSGRSRDCSSSPTSAADDTRSRHAMEAGALKRGLPSPPSILPDAPSTGLFTLLPTPNDDEEEEEEAALVEGGRASNPAEVAGDVTSGGEYRTQRIPSATAIHDTRFATAPSTSANTTTTNATAATTCTLAADNTMFTHSARRRSWMPPPPLVVATVPSSESRRPSSSMSSGGRADGSGGSTVESTTTPSLLLRSGEERRRTEGTVNNTVVAHATMSPATAARTSPGAHPNRSGSLLGSIHQLALAPLATPLSGDTSSTSLSSTTLHYGGGSGAGLTRLTSSPQAPTNVRGSGGGGGGGGGGAASDYVAGSSTTEVSGRAASGGTPRTSTFAASSGGAVMQRGKPPPLALTPTPRSTGIILPPPPTTAASAQQQRSIASSLHGANTGSATALTTSSTAPTADHPPPPQTSSHNATTTAPVHRRRGPPPSLFRSQSPVVPITATTNEMANSTAEGTTPLNREPTSSTTHGASGCSLLSSTSHPRGYVTAPSRMSPPSAAGMATSAMDAYSPCQPRVSGNGLNSHFSSASHAVGGGVNERPGSASPQTRRHHHHHHRPALVRLSRDGRTLIAGMFRVSRDGCLTVRNMLLLNPTRIDVAQSGLQMATSTLSGGGGASGGGGNGSPLSRHAPTSAVQLLHPQRPSAMNYSPVSSTGGGQGRMPMMESVNGPATPTTTANSDWCSPNLFGAGTIGSAGFSRPGMANAASSMLRNGGGNNGGGGAGGGYDAGLIAAASVTVHQTQHSIHPLHNPGSTQHNPNASFTLFSTSMNTPFSPITYSLDSQRFAFPTMSTMAMDRGSVGPAQSSMQLLRAVREEGGVVGGGANGTTQDGASNGAFLVPHGMGSGAHIGTPNSLAQPRVAILSSSNHPGGNGTYRAQMRRHASGSWINASHAGTLLGVSPTTLHTAGSVGSGFGQGADPTGSLLMPYADIPSWRGGGGNGGALVSVSAQTSSQMGIGSPAIHLSQGYGAAGGGGGGGAFTTTSTAGMNAFASVSFTGPAIPPNVVRLRDLEVLASAVGDGASATVFVAIHKPTSRRLAVKRVLLESLCLGSASPFLRSGGGINGRIKQLQQIVVRELQVLHLTYRSPFMVKVYNAFFLPELPSLDIVMEFMHYGSLDHVAAALQAHARTVRASQQQRSRLLDGEDDAAVPRELDDGVDGEAEQSAVVELGALTGNTSTKTNHSTTNGTGEATGSLEAACAAESEKEVGYLSPKSIQFGRRLDEQRQQSQLLGHRLGYVHRPSSSPPQGHDEGGAGEDDLHDNLADSLPPDAFSVKSDCGTDDTELDDGSGLIEEAFSVTERLVAVVGEQLLSGVRDMHSRGYIHRDIKPGNVLVNEHGVIKLSDFGLSQRCDDSGTGIRNAAMSFVPPPSAAPTRNNTPLHSPAFTALQGSGYSRARLPILSPYAQQPTPLRSSVAPHPLSINATSPDLCSSGDPMMLSGCVSNSTAAQRDGLDVLETASTSSSDSAAEEEGTTVGGGKGHEHGGGLALSSTSSDSSPDPAENCSGTEKYMSPERQRGESHGRPADIWALGVTLAEFAVGEYPYNFDDIIDEFDRVHRLEAPVDVLQFNEHRAVPLSSVFADFIRIATLPMATQRPTAQELLEHPFFKQWSKPFNLKDYLAARVPVPSSELKNEYLAKVRGEMPA